MTGPLAETQRVGVALVIVLKDYDIFHYKFRYGSSIKPLYISIFYTPMHALQSSQTLYRNSMKWNPYNLDGVFQSLPMTLGLWPRVWNF